jgi:hypothetical protein
MERLDIIVARAKELVIEVLVMDYNKNNRTVLGGEVRKCRMS